ncbi:MAG: right-handed parallel beta-helix repeat-containing protein [Opitutales bacterium]|nr:right-handed parallel beta-helix repeat-containing protein [Opitutales bacterium]
MISNFFSLVTRFFLSGLRRSVLFLSGVAVLPAAGTLVHDPFSDGGVTEGDDPYDVHWFTSDSTHVDFTVVEDTVLDPEPPHRVANFLINNPAEVEKDDYIFFALPETVELEVGEAIEVTYRLRFEGGAPRADASRTGLSLAYRAPGASQSPWAHPGNREYFFFTSFGADGFGGSIRKSAGVQILNTGTVLGANTPTVDLANGVGTVIFEVARMDETTVRIRYGLNGMPPREAFDSSDITTAFSHVFLRYRRATLQPLEAMRIDDMRVVLTAVDLTPPEPRTWYVRQDGNDVHAGDDPEAPFRTISHALAWARAGDTIEIGGGVYAEALFIPYAGEPDAPITLRAAAAPEGGFEEVVVNGFEPVLPGVNGVGEWTLHEGAVWRVPLPPERVLSLGRNLVEVDGEVLLPARWPTAGAPVDFDRRSMAEASDGSVDASTAHAQPPYPGTNFYDATYTDDALSAFSADAWAGARVDLCAGHNWWPKTGVVTGNMDDQLHFRFRFETNWNHVIDTPKEGDRYALWGHLTALDTPGEFFVDVHGTNGPPGMLYVWFPDSGAPHGREVSMLARQGAVVLGDRSHIVMEGIRVRGGTLSMNAASQYNCFDQVEVDYGAVNRNRLEPGDGASVLLAGDNHVFTNGRVGHSYGRSIEVAGAGTEVSNTVSHDAGSHLITLHGAVGAHVAGNTVYRSGDTAIDIGAKGSVIEFNHAYHAGMRITDIAVMNTWNSGDMEGTEIRYNWVHSNLAPLDLTRSWWGGQGIRLDSGGAPLGCSNARIHHNVVWNTTSRSSLAFWGLGEGMENFGNSQIKVYHNTLDDRLVFGGSGSVAGGDVRNNVARAFNNPTGSLDGITFTDNLFRDDAVAGNLQADPGFVSAPNRNFQLRPGAAAIGTGAPVESVTESAPQNYLGAYNHAAAPWTPGARLRSGDLRHLVTSVETGPLGQTRVLVTGLPPGRTFPDGFAMRLDGREAISREARYFPSEHAVTGVFTFDFSGIGAAATVEFSLDGSEWVVPDSAVVALPEPSITSAGPFFGTSAGGSEHVIFGNYLSGGAVPLHALRVRGLAGADFIAEAIPWIADTTPWTADGMGPSGQDLRFFSWDGETPVRHHVEYGIGGDNTLIWLKSGEGPEGDVVSFEDRSRIFLAYGDESLPGGDDPAVLSDSFPALVSADRLLHLRAHDLAAAAAEDDPVSHWPDNSPFALPVLQEDPVSQPKLRLNSFGGLPAVAFDGVNDHLDVNGAAGIGTGSGRIFTVYRNPDPGSVRWQRLYSSRAGTEVFDYETGFYAIIPTTSEGDPLPRPAPTIREMNRQGGFSGENFRIGRRSLSTAEPFRGEIAEMIAFSGDFTGAPREQILRYLQRKYGIVERPVVDLSANETVEPLRVFVGGEEALWVRRENDGSLRFAAPPYTGGEPLPVSADVTVRRADGAEAVFAGGYIYSLSYGEWAGSLPEDERAPGHAPHGHGIPNLLRFAFGGDADAPTVPAGMPHWTDTPEGTVVEFIRRGGGLMEHHAYRMGELRYIVEVSPDLQEWTPLSWNPFFIEDIGNGTERVWVELPADPPRWFHRIRVVMGE